MSTPLRSRPFRIVSLCAIVVIMSLALVPGASANDKVPIPPGPPFYARIVMHCAVCVQHNAEWAVIPFYHLPKDVPADFNLLDQFDVPNAFLVESTVTGFEIWKEWPPAPGSTAGPLVVQLHGMGAVPVWFVPWEGWLAATNDDMLTIGELENVPGLLKGTADFYKETLIPAEEATAGLVVLQIQARGELEDGPSFQVESVTHNVVGTIPNITWKENTRVVFR
jgi:hypothetical protein